MIRGSGCQGSWGCQVLGYLGVLGASCQCHSGQLLGHLMAPWLEMLSLGEGPAQTETWLVVTATSGSATATATTATITTTTNSSLLWCQHHLASVTHVGTLESTQPHCCGAGAGAWCGWWPVPSLAGGRCVW